MSIECYFAVADTVIDTNLNIPGFVCNTKNYGFSEDWISGYY